MNMTFNPNDLSVENGNYFALPYSLDQSKLVLVSAPWDVTVSYREGTSLAPDAIIAASAQVDLYDFDNPRGYEKGITTLPCDQTILEKSRSLRSDAIQVIDHLAQGGSPSDNQIKALLSKINSESDTLNEKIYSSTIELLRQGKKVGLVGGDHSTPFGYIKAIVEHIGDISILHIDAHADLRDAYEGFDYSHASIMHNVINKIDNISSLVQVGIRDFCEDELDLINSNDKITTYFDADLKRREFEGENWAIVCRDIVESLKTNNVYVSFDIDGLTPDNCPSTGTPVPGGLSYEKAAFLLKQITLSGREIVGFDLVEVAPHPSGEDEWDANVGARMLYKLCNLALL